MNRSLMYIGTFMSYLLITNSLFGMQIVDGIKRACSNDADIRVESCIPNKMGNDPKQRKRDVTDALESLMIKEKDTVLRRHQRATLIMSWANNKNNIPHVNSRINAKVESDSVKAALAGYEYCTVLHFDIMRQLMENQYLADSNEPQFDIDTILQKIKNAYRLYQMQQSSLPTPKSKPHSPQRNSRETKLQPPIPSINPFTSASEEQPEFGPFQSGETPAHLAPADQTVLSTPVANHPLKSTLSTPPDTQLSKKLK